MEHKRHKTFSLEAVRDELIYDPMTGHFTWRFPQSASRMGKPRSNGILGRVNHKGYRELVILGKSALAHRMAWFYTYGRWPKEQIDHINHARDDNRIANLRECTNAENRQNIRPEGYGKSGMLGVYPKGDGWTAQIALNGKNTYLGFFDSPEYARAAYLSAKAKMHLFATRGVSVAGGQNR